MKFGRTLLASLCTGVLLAGGLAACTATDQVQTPTATEKTQIPVPTQSASDRGYDRFRTAVAKIPDRKFQVYWLGRQFTDGVLTYDGPSFAGTADNDADVLELDYTAKLASGGGTGIDLSLYSRDGWQRASRVLKKAVGGRG
jgi:hypothetical protein